MEKLNVSEDFKDLPPDQLVNMFDDDEKQRFGNVFASSFNRTNDVSIFSPRKPDISVGSYFQTRSSLPFSSMLGNANSSDRFPNDPPEQDKPVQLKQVSIPESIRREDRSRFEASAENKRHSSTEAFINRIPEECELKSNTNPKEMHQISMNQSISHLAKYFADPEKRPMSSTEIMEHVMEYCRSRKSSDSFLSRNSLSVQSIMETRKRTSEVFQSFSKSKNAEASIRVRTSESYHAFTKDIGRKSSSSRCSTPDSGNSSLSGCEKQAHHSTHLAVAPKNVGKKPRIETADNKENVKVEEQNDKLHLQLHLPPSMLGETQGHNKPVVINIACPRPRASSTSSVAEGTTSSETYPASEGRQSAASALQRTCAVSTISINLTGTIQFH